MTCPRCKCPECRRIELQAVLSRHVSRETDYGEGPAVTLGLPLVEAANAQAVRDMNERELWRDTYEPAARRFREPREIGKPPVDPDAEQLAGQVGALAGELARGAA